VHQEPQQEVGDIVRASGHVVCGSAGSIRVHSAKGLCAGRVWMQLCIT